MNSFGEPLSISKISDSGKSLDNVGVNHSSEQLNQPDPDNQLSQLKQQEDELSQAVMRLESQHKAKAQQHRSCIKQLRDIKSELEQIQRDFQAKATEYETVVERNNGFVAEMNQISAERTAKVAELDAVRNQIRSLTVVTVFAYANGDVESLDETNFPISDKGSEELFAALRTQERFDDLRGKDIRALSRLLAIIHNAGDIRIEPVFENEELEPYFHELVTHDLPSTSPQ